MKEPVWVPREAILVLHAQSLARYGGLSGIRDQGLFEAASARARQVFTYDPEADIATLAAAYAGAFMRNHPFVDGNKRAGTAACLTFLRLNGLRLDVTDDALTEKALGLASRALSEDAFADWIRTNVTPG